jgi:RNA polymerase sigma-70 factor (ECF subfamily)
MAEQDVAQFEALIVPHLDAAYTLARYLLRDEHDAQDAVQDAALRAFRHFEGFRGGDARGWFMAIVRNRCFTRLRSDRRAAQITAVLPHHYGSVATEPRSADAAAIEESDRAAIAQAVASLPAEYREVIVLRELQDLSYSEISGVVGVPIGTVMSRLSRARRRLAKALGQGVKEAG